MLRDILSGIKIYLESQWTRITGHFVAIMAYLGTVAFYFGLLGFPGTYRLVCISRYVLPHIIYACIWALKPCVQGWVFK